MAQVMCQVAQDKNSELLRNSATREY